MRTKVVLRKHVVACIGWSYLPDVSPSFLLSRSHTHTHTHLMWMLRADYSIFIVDIGSSFWGMLLILASTNLLTSRIAAGCFLVSLLVVLCVAKNVSSFFYIFILSVNCVILQLIDHLCSYRKLESKIESTRTWFHGKCIVLSSFLWIWILDWFSSKSCH